jgi:hypothetical protein
MDVEDRLKINKSIRRLIRRDKYFLQNNAAERCIVHKLAMYIQDEYKSYNVDCEYNLNTDNEYKRKIISCIKSEYEKVRTALVSRRTHLIDDVEYIESSVYPDIIVHRRGSNDHNKMIIEVKKSNNLNDIEYDHYKLKKYTGQGSEFKYPVGIFLKLFVDTEFNNGYEIIEFFDGEIVSTNNRFN